MCWLETSAKDCTNVEEAFETMASKLCESHEQYLSFESERSGPGSFTLHGAYGVPEENEKSRLLLQLNMTYLLTGQLMEMRGAFQI